MIPCCCNCEGMAFWDGDYVCTMQMMIHQYGYPNGVWMNEDFEKTLKTKDECDDYSYTPYNDMYEQEFVKYLIWKRLKKEHYNRMHG